jgi:hypothetical protein
MPESSRHRDLGISGAPVVPGDWNISATPRADARNEIGSKTGRAPAPVRTLCSAHRVRRLDCWADCIRTVEPHGHSLEGALALQVRCGVEQRSRVVTFSIASTISALAI